MANLKIENIDADTANLCDILVYSFVKIDNTTFDKIVPILDTDHSKWNTFYFKVEFKFRRSRYCRVLKTLKLSRF